ncbi:hypothetical protein [Nannocystis pusilla]|uniref:hypothetical protein n=1 Tax=Nannocystis pusilla TaxID=889268 RepID=UPI003B81F8C1
MLVLVSPLVLVLVSPPVLVLVSPPVLVLASPPVLVVLVLVSLLVLVSSPVLVLVLVSSPVLVLVLVSSPVLLVLVLLVVVVGSPSSGGGQAHSPRKIQPTWRIAGCIVVIASVLPGRQASTSRADSPEKADGSPGPRPLQAGEPISRTLAPARRSCFD